MHEFGPKIAEGTCHSARTRYKKQRKPKLISPTTCCNHFSFFIIFSTNTSQYPHKRGTEVKAISSSPDSLLKMATKLFTLFNFLFSPNKLNSTTYGDEAPKHRVGEWETNIGFYQAIELMEDSLLYKKKSKYQSIEVHQSKFYGKVLILDDVLQITERDANSYNEMMAHVPMFQHENPKRVLVIGGGDGYALVEVLKHDSVEHVDHVDLDEDVIKTCETYFPQWGSGWKDPRVKLHIKDGAEFVKNIADGTYDVIVQDSSDPYEVEADGSITPMPSGALYEEMHFLDLQRILAPDGILMIQGESYSIPSSLDSISTWRELMAKCGFQRTRYGNIMTSSYPTGQIGFLLAEKNPSASTNNATIVERYEKLVNSGKATTYYHPPLQNR
jgi:spermidine synthase